MTATAACPVDFSRYPDAHGRFGRFGGRYVPEVLMPALDELTSAYAAARVDHSFIDELDKELKHYAGRPTALTLVQRLSSQIGAQIYLKREDLAHTGAHKINNAIGQVLLAKRMGKKRLIAETGAGQHGVAVATVAARYGMACTVYSGSNAMGMFYPFLNDAQVKLFGIEAAGEGLDSSRHAAPLSHGRPGVLHGAMSYMLQNQDGQVQEAHSISAGLDYPGVGPEHSFLKEAGRVTYAAVTDQEALAAFKTLAKLEGLLPALETAHALAYLHTLQFHLTTHDVVVLCFSGRGDKDVENVRQATGASL